MLCALALASLPASGAVPSPREVAARITPAVVSIAAYDRWGDELSTGTGFLVDEQGTFVTNQHVLEGAASLKVELSTGEQFTQVYSLVVDADRDIAILRIPAEQTPAAVLGVDRDLEVGDTIFVMGNPLGLDRTFSNGMVSARRVIEGSDTIQITAAISPGSSGGPVMNEHGHVIGIATWYLEHGQNLNMAVPIRYVRPLLALHHTPVLFQGEQAEQHALVAAPVSANSRQQASLIDPASEDQWVQQVLEQLAGIEEIFLAEKFVRSHEPVTGDLFAGESGAISMTLQKGVEYLLVGACDADCQDIDMFLYDKAQTLLVEDQEDDDLPALPFTPPRTMDVTVRVRMFACNAEPCSYGVAVFREQ
jgi:S1-C subfamily serine protease